MAKISKKQWLMMSPAQKFANMSPEQQEEVLGGIDIAELEYEWDNWWARPNQVISDEPYYPLHLLLTGRGWGKALAVDTPIPTPTGWTTMGDIKVGDTVYDENGHYCTVTQVHDVYTPDDGDMYRLNFFGGGSIEACGDHLWTVVEFPYIENIRNYRNSKLGMGHFNMNELDWTKDNFGEHKAKTKTTRELAEDIYYYTETGATRWMKHYVGRSKSLRGTYTKCKEDEYILGAILPTLEEHEIPWEMLRATPVQRWSIIQGLCDLHGEMIFHRDQKRHSVKITKKVLDGPPLDFAVELIRTMGMYVVKKKQDDGAKKKNHHIVFRPHSLNPFRHSENKYEFRYPIGEPETDKFISIRSIKKIEPKPVRCITVDSESALYLAGEHMIPTHNTRTMSEWIRKQATNYPGCRIGILGRTSSDVRDIAVLGESGLLNVGPEEERPEYKPSLRQVQWPNGSIATMYSAEVPDQLRGQQFHYFACDELAAYTQSVGADGLTAFQNIRIATRLGEHPYGIVATTPKRVPVIRELLEEAETGRVRVVRGATKENNALSSSYKSIILGQFEGTTLEKQELEGEMLDDFPEGALWTQDNIDQYRIVQQFPPATPGGVIIAVDPSVANEPKDECGIVVIGFSAHRQLHKRHAYVLEDGSLRASPDEWAQRVNDLYLKWNASAVVVETNQGRDLLTQVLHTVNPAMRVIGVNASQGKKLRAEPVVLPYQQGRVHHYGLLPELETQLTTWEPEVSKKSPDRLDALVHGITAVLIKVPDGLPMGGGRRVIRPVSRVGLSKGSGRVRASPRGISMSRRRRWR